MIMDRTSGGCNMKYLIIGDTHGSIDLGKVTTEILDTLEPDDAIIHCGDFGAPWTGDEHDPTLQFWRSLKNRVYICLGNHENYDWILRQPVVESTGGTCYQLGDNLFAPFLGEILTIGKKRFWFYSGGYSVDFLYRTPGKTIWKQELATREESSRAIERLKQSGGVDFIITHDGPREFIMKYWGYPIGGPKPAYYKLLGVQEQETIHPGFALDEVYQRPDLWQRWFFGHHHRDDDRECIRPIFRDIILIQDDQETIL